MTEQKVAELVWALQGFYVVFLTKQKTIELRNWDGKVLYHFRDWESVARFAQHMNDGKEGST